METRLVVEGADRNELEHGLQALREHDNMHGCSLLSKRDNVAYIRTVIGQTEAMEAIRSHDGYITGPFYIEDGHELWHVGFDHETLEHAVRDGYFQSPRSATLGTLADEFGVSKPPSRRICGVANGR